MNYRALGGWQQGPGFGGDAFPGIGEPLAGPPAIVNPEVLPAAQATAAKAAGGFSMANIAELKNVFDRMGGLEGVLSTVGKLQKFMSTMQQMAPLLKMFMNKGAKVAKSNDDDGELNDIPPRRRKSYRRRRGASRPRARKRR